MQIADRWLQASRSGPSLRFSHPGDAQPLVSQEPLDGKSVLRSGQENRARIQREAKEPVERSGPACELSRKRKGRAKAGACTSVPRHTKPGFVSARSND